MELMRDVVAKRSRENDLSIEYLDALSDLETRIVERRIAEGRMPGRLIPERFTWEAVQMLPELVSRGPVPWAAYMVGNNVYYKWGRDTNNELFAWVRDRFAIPGTIPATACSLTSDVIIRALRNAGFDFFEVVG